MGVRFITLEEQAKMPTYKLKKRTYLDAEGKATTDESKGVSLFGIEGDDVLAEDAFRAGLLDKEPKTEEEPEPQMVYYNREGKRVKADDPDVAVQYLDNSPDRPDSPERAALAAHQAEREAIKPGPSSAEAQAAAAEEAAKPVNYANLNKADLVELAEKRGLEPEGGQTRQHYIDALTAADEA